MLEDAKAAIEICKEFRYNKAFIWAIPFVGLLLGLYLPFPVNVADNLAIRIVLGAILLVAFGFAGFWIAQAPRNRKNHLGVAFAIKADTGSVRRKVAWDIVAETKKLLENLDCAQPFYVFDVGNGLSSKLESHADAVALRNKCKAHMLIYGEAKKRSERGKEFYVLRLEGLVVHAPANPGARKLLGHEMMAVMPLKTEIDKKNELSGFEITSLQLSLSIRYVIATAALMTGDGPLASQLLDAIAMQDQELKKPGGIKAVHKLRELLPLRQQDTYQFMSLALIREWEETRANETLVEAISWLKKSPALVTGKKNYSYLLISSIAAFVLEQNVAEAQKLINKCKARYISNPAWMYSAAFLSAYQGRLDEAMGHYDSAFMLEQSAEVPFQIEGFLGWRLEITPDITELYFCLAYVNEKYKEDLITAQQNYSEFLKRTVKLPEKSLKAKKHAEWFVANQANGFQKGQSSIGATHATA